MNPASPTLPERGGDGRTGVAEKAAGRPRIAVLFGRFGPYHGARLRGAARRAEVLAMEGVPLDTIYAWERPELPVGMDYVALAGQRGEELDARLIERRLDEALPRFAPDAIAIPGWSGLPELVTLRWASRRGFCAICMSESNPWDFRRNPLVERLKRGVMAHFAAGLATSASQMGYLARLGLPAESIFSGYNAVDNDYFAEQAAHWRDLPGLPDLPAAILPQYTKSRYFLASSRFVPKKNLARLLDAYAHFRAGRRDDPADWPLVLLGDGELRPALEAQIARLGLARHVHLPGFLQLADLPQFYGTAGGFVQASTVEQWGLVINEAMASGLPCAVSDRCGAAEFLIEDGRTGFRFDPLDIEAIAEALGRLADLAPDSPLRAAARARIDTLRPETFGEGLARAAEAGRASPARPGWFDRRCLDIAIRTATRRMGI